MIVFRCPGCSAIWQADDRAASTEYACGACGLQMTVPRSQLETLQALLAALPFRPFRVHMPSGPAVVVTHPELVTIDGERVSIELSGASAANVMGLSAEERPRCPDACRMGFELPACMIGRIEVLR